MRAFQRLAVEVKSDLVRRIDFQPRQRSANHIFVFLVVKQAGHQRRQQFVCDQQPQLQQPVVD
ncbi:hypothetical protein D3C87_2113590 [compost metagenome]